MNQSFVHMFLEVGGVSEAPHPFSSRVRCVLCAQLCCGGRGQGEPLLMPPLCIIHFLDGGWAVAVTVSLDCLDT